MRENVADARARAVRKRCEPTSIPLHFCPCQIVSGVTSLTLTMEVALDGARAPRNTFHFLWSFSRGASNQCLLQEFSRKVYTSMEIRYISCREGRGGGEGWDANCRGVTPDVQSEEYTGEEGIYSSVDQCSHASAVAQHRSKHKMHGRTTVRNLEMKVGEVVRVTQYHNGTREV